MIPKYHNLFNSVNYVPHFLRLGKYVVDSPETASHLLETEIPNNPHIPDKVKKAFSIALKEMLNPKKRQTGLDGLDPMEMMKKVIVAGPDSPPVVKAMQEKLRKEMEEERFEKLKRQYK